MTSCLVEARFFPIFSRRENPRLGVEISSMSATSTHFLITPQTQTETHYAWHFGNNKLKGVLIFLFGGYFPLLVAGGNLLYCALYIHQINTKWSASPFLTRTGRNRFNENKQNKPCIHNHKQLTGGWKNFSRSIRENIEKRQNHGLLKVNIERKRKKSRSENFSCHKVIIHWRVLIKTREVSLAREISMASVWWIQWD